MSNRIRKYVAAATLAASLAGGGSLITANAANMIASTADAGQPSIEPGKGPIRTN